MRSRRYERSIGSNADDQATFGSADNEPAKTLRAYGQWYETDRTRLGEECGLLTEASIKFECCRMPDARLSFICHIEEIPVAIVCPHNYPIAPPEAIHVGELALPDMTDGIGRINLFADREFTWSADSHVLDVVRKVEAMMNTDFHRHPERDDESPASSHVEVVPLHEVEDEDIY